MSREEEREMRCSMSDTVRSVQDLRAHRRGVVLWAVLLAFWLACLAVLPAAGQAGGCTAPPGEVQDVGSTPSRSTGSSTCTPA